MREQHPKLTLPEFPIKTRVFGELQHVFDPIRRKYVALTPEEWVRQHFINYLIEYKNYPAGLLAVEHPVMVNKMQQRVDIAAFSRDGSPLLVVECKAPEVKLSHSVFEQASRYNLTLRAPLLAVTNGIKHFCSRVNLEQQSFTMLRELPDY